MLIPFDYITKKYKMNIHGILHIGAHMCEEISEYNKYGIKNNKIIWIEANPNLVKKNLEIDNTRIMKNYIACEKDSGTSKLNIASNGQSSSILEFGSHSSYYPNITYNDSVEVQNIRIDTMYKNDKIQKNFANFVNLDIQGAELKALKGMDKLLNYFDYIYLEVNKEKVYKDCPLIDEIDSYLDKFNFKRVETKWTDAGWGDAFYVKNKKNYIKRSANNYILYFFIFIFILFYIFFN